MWAESAESDDDGPDSLFHKVRLGDCVVDVMQAAGSANALRHSKSSAESSKCYDHSGCSTA